jgi:hypothetical protein
LGSKVQSTIIDQKCYAQLKKVYLMWSEIQPVVMRAQKCNIQISRVTYLFIKNFIFSVNKYTFRSFYMELEVFFAIIQET